MPIRPVLFASYPSCAANQANAEGPKAAEVASRTRRGVKFWDVLLVLVLLIALIEPWLANRITARHYGEAKLVAADPLARTGQGAGRLTARAAAEASAS